MKYLNEITMWPISINKTVVTTITIISLEVYILRGLFSLLTVRKYVFAIACTLYYITKKTLIVSQVYKSHVKNTNLYNVWNML